jgi:hypothetical protein
MPNSFMVVTEKDWEKATPERRAWMTFNTLQALSERTRRLENKAFIEKVYSFAGGILGGALAVWAYLGLKVVR